MTTPQESPDAEITPGDVTENPAKPDEDSSNPHVEGDDDSQKAPSDPANITDAHPDNQPEED